MTRALFLGNDLRWRRRLAGPMVERSPEAIAGHPGCGGQAGKARLVRQSRASVFAGGRGKWFKTERPMRE
jgi:hypothetical protein